MITELKPMERPSRGVLRIGCAAGGGCANVALENGYCLSCSTTMIAILLRVVTHMGLDPLTLQAEWVREETGRVLSADEAYRLLLDIKFAATLEAMPLAPPSRLDEVTGAITERVDVGFCACEEGYAWWQWALGFVGLAVVVVCCIVVPMAGAR